MPTYERISYEPLVPSVEKFMQIAGQTTNRMNAQQAGLYTGLQLEELGEKLSVIRSGCLTAYQKQQFNELISLLDQFSNEFKAGLHSGAILRSDHAELIDADFDLAWVSIGALMSSSPLPNHAIAHGTFTNLDKFRGGVCNKDANGKVQKPADWKKPNFEQFVDLTCRV